MVNSAITRAFSAREKAVHAQEAAMGALNLPSAADIDRLTRRLRTVSTRLEGIEESLDRLQDGVDKLRVKLGSEAALVERLSALERQLSKLTHDVSHVSDAIDAVPPPVPREQERLAVDEAPASKPAGKRAATNNKSE